jgi:hypothetical protein
MKKWTCTALGLLASSALTPSLYAQIPDVPAAPSATTAASTAAGLPTRNIWSNFCLTPDQAAKCRDKLCNSPLGQMLTSAAKPLTLMSGGLLFAKCGVPTADDIKKFAEGSAEGEAAKIKKSEAEAKARREAMRYLGTVDCNWWPEAKGALINGLRADPNECVRYEAALALLRGCCCNKQIMNALKISANGTHEDGNPPENSSRVRETAAEALAHCAEVFVEQGEAPGQRKQKEAASPPVASMHGKGLMGIFAGAAMYTPPANVQAKILKPAPVALTDQAVASTAPVQTTVVQRPEKRGLFQRIDWVSHNTNSQAMEAKPPESIGAMRVDTSVTPMSAVTPANSITPVNYGPAPINFVPAPAIQNAVPFSTSAPGANNPTIVPMRPGEEPVVPTRGIVVFDGNSVR